MKITVVGLGYVGLSNAAMLAREHEVVALDVDPERVLTVNGSHSTVEDPFLAEWLDNQPLRLHATLDPHYAYDKAEFIVIAVPTNFDEETGCFDTSIVERVVADAVWLNESGTIVIRSTVPVGFTRSLQRKYPERHILFVPEFLREGHSLEDTLNPSRIIIGSYDDGMDEKFGRLLDAYSGHGYSVIPATEAEAIKLFSNTYLAMRVAFFNELDTFAMAHNLNAPLMIEGVSQDPRIGHGYNNPSFGYGGYCLPKDTKQLRNDFLGVPESLMTAIVSANETRKQAIADDILSRVPENGTVGIYRLVMKAGSSNFRESAVLDLIGYLLDAGRTVVVYEPELAESTFAGTDVLGDLDEFAARSDLIVANRLDDQITRVQRGGGLYTRDIWQRD